jgi:hypothetical protein
MKLPREQPSIRSGCPELSAGKAFGLDLYNAVQKPEGEITDGRLD